MCFSMESSFAAAIVLTGIGIASLRQVRNHPQYLMLATTPLTFALQQASEGIVWMTMNNQNYAWLNNMMGQVFLMFAMIIWPLWLPISLFIFETEAWRKKVLQFLMGIGLFVSSYSAYVMATSNLNINITCNSISYSYVEGTTGMVSLSLIMYTLAVVAPLFITRLKLGWFLGSSLIIALIVSKMFKEAAFGSVWCFCAAILSILIIVSLKQEIKSR